MSNHIQEHENHLVLRVILTTRGLIDVNDSASPSQTAGTETT